MVGSNLPVDRLFAQRRAILGTITATVARYSASERRMMPRGTVDRIYRI